MSDWTKRITDHPFMGALSSAVSYLETLDAPADVAAAADLARVRHVLSTLRSRLAGADPALLLPKPLTALQPTLQAILDTCKAFGQSSQRTHLVNANQHLDSLLVSVAALPLSAATVDNESASSTIESVRRRSEETHRVLLDQVEEARKQASVSVVELTQLRSAIAEQQKRNDAAIAQHQQQHSAAQDERQKQFAKAEAARAEAEQKRTEAFAAGQEARKQEFERVLNALREEASAQEARRANELSEKEAARESRFTKLEADAKLKADTLIAELVKLKARAEELVRVTANTGMVGGYQKNANDERSAARLWKSIAFFAALGLVVFAVLAFVFTTSSSFSWPMFAGRVFVATTFGLLGVYAARLADRHLRAERVHRQAELELASIDPFLVGLPEGEAQQIKKSFAQRAFGRPHPEDAPTDLMPAAGLSVDALGKIVELVRETKRGV